MSQTVLDNFDIMIIRNKNLKIHLGPLLSHVDEPDKEVAIAHYLHRHFIARRSPEFTGGEIALDSNVCQTLKFHKDSNQVLCFDENILDRAADYNRICEQFSLINNAFGLKLLYYIETIETKKQKFSILHILKTNVIWIYRMCIRIGAFRINIIKILLIICTKNYSQKKLKQLHPFIVAILINHFILVVITLIHFTRVPNVLDNGF